MSGGAVRAVNDGDTLARKWAAPKSSAVRNFQVFSTLLAVRLQPRPELLMLNLPES